MKRDDDEPAEIYVLYGDGCKIGYVRYIDYKDNGRHGYGIRAVNEELFQMFQIRRGVFQFAGRIPGKRFRCLASPYLSGRSGPLQTGPGRGISKY